MSLLRVGRQAALDAEAANMTHAGLSTTLPAVDGTNVTEPTLATNGYARQAVTWGSASSTASPSERTTLVTSGSITFGPVTTASWVSGTAVAYVVLYNSTTGTAAANIRGYAALSTTVSMTVGTSLTVSSITFTMTVS